jgi:GNAT superfamily N-acetyltransferase
VSAEVHLRTALRPGDLGYVAWLHGTLYAREQGWDVTFEAYVAAALADFALGYDAATHRLWLAERAGVTVGSIAIVPADEDGAAQLRWFLVHPAARGRGLGRRLIGAALDFCRAAGYERVFLWTVTGLESAAHLYRGAGFRRTHAEPHARWGARVTEERYELGLTPASGAPASRMPGRSA